MSDKSNPKPISIINDVGGTVEVDVSVTVDLNAAQSRDGIDWGDLREVTIRVEEADDER